MPDGHAAVVILSAPAEDDPAGKFVVGRSVAEGGALVLAFDTACTFHKDIGEKYGLRPMGGGWCEVVERRHEVWISGYSTQFGREPDRAVTLALFQAALPAYRVEEED
ncbi:MAG TPA: hypothetical protein VGK29_28040 [Paludibaculum sp.]